MAYERLGQLGECISAGLVRWNVRDPRWMSVAWILEEHRHRQGCGPDKASAWTIGVTESQSAEWTKNAGGRMCGGSQTQAWGGGPGGTLPYVRPMGSCWTLTGVRMNGTRVLWMVNMAWMGGRDTTCGGDDGMGETQHGGLGTSVWKPVDKQQV